MALEGSECLNYKHRWVLESRRGSIPCLCKSYVQGTRRNNTFPSRRIRDRSRRIQAACTIRKS